MGWVGVCVCVRVVVGGGGGKSGDARDEHVGGGEDGRGWERVEVVVVVVVAVVVVVVVVEDWRRQLTLRKKEEGLSEQVLNLCPILAQRARLLFLSSLGDTHNDYKTTHRTTLGNIYKSHPLAGFRHLNTNAVLREDVMHAAKRGSYRDVAATERSSLDGTL